MRELSNEEIIFLDDMFDTRSQRKSLADDAQLAGMSISKYTSKTLEITLNVQRNSAEYKKLNIEQKKEYLSEIFGQFCKEFMAESSYHVIEYCKDGEPHLHGYVNLRIPDKIMSYGITEILRMYARAFYMRLPRIMFKQWATADINIHLSRFKATGLCINMKSYLEQGWQDYMKKTH